MVILVRILATRPLAAVLSARMYTTRVGFVRYNGMRGDQDAEIGLVRAVRSMQAIGAGMRRATDREARRVSRHYRKRPM